MHHTGYDRYAEEDTCTLSFVKTTSQGEYTSVAMLLDSKVSYMYLKV